MDEPADLLPRDDWDRFRDLMRRTEEGSEDAAWELVRDYQGYLRRAVRRVLNPQLRSKFDSMDFVQLAWRSFFRVRRRAGQFQERQHFLGYLAGIARKKVLVENRRRLATKRRNLRREVPLDELPDELHEEMISPDPGPSDVAIARERWERLFEGQSAHHRRILKLKLQGYTAAAIAAKLDLDPQTVRRFLKRLLDATVT